MTTKATNTRKTKRCTHCGSTRRVSQFNLSRTNPTGYQPWCRSCQKEAREAKKAEQLQNA